MKCGLLGEKLGHSYSPQIHNSLGSYSYELFEKQPEELAQFLQSGAFHGLNVTIPYKKAVIPYLTELSPIAAKLGAVNTIVRRKDGSLIGHNTDYFGFKTMVKASGLQVSGKKTLILGSGGASNTAVAVMKALGSQVIIISRSGENNYSNLNRHRDAAIIVNTTPVGMYPNVSDSPVSLEQFPALEGVLDLIFNPARTRLLQEAKARGLVAMNGLLMLVAQAKESAEWFTGSAIEDEKISLIHQALQKKMQNIVLIGMPGCGKTSVAAKLAHLTGKEVVDADAEIVVQAGMTIPEIFAKSGEAAFRRLETQVLEQLGKRSGIILSTGGGCVTRPENYPLLHQNGRIFWLKRQIAALPTDGRPISQTTDLNKLFECRRPLYEAFADEIIENNGTLADAAEKIREKLL
jgi:shikimate dehydrogenase